MLSCRISHVSNGKMEPETAQKHHALPPHSATQSKRDEQHTKYSNFEERHQLPTTTTVR